MTGQWVCGERHVDVHVRVLIRCLGRADRLHIPQTIAPSHRVQVFSRCVCTSLKNLWYDLSGDVPAEPACMGYPERLLRRCDSRIVVFPHTASKMWSPSQLLSCEK